MKILSRQRITFQSVLQLLDGASFLISPSANATSIAAPLPYHSAVRLGPSAELRNDGRLDVVGDSSARLDGAAARLSLGEAAKLQIGQTGHLTAYGVVLTVSERALLVIDTELVLDTGAELTLDSLANMTLSAASSGQESQLEVAGDIVCP